MGGGGGHTVCVCACVRACVCACVCVLVLVLVLAERCIFGEVFPQGVWQSPHVWRHVRHALVRTTHTHRRPRYLDMAPLGSLGLAFPLLLPSIGGGLFERREGCGFGVIYKSGH